MSGPDLAEFRLFCSTENAYKYVWGVDTTPPTLCPTNTSHTIDANSITIVNTRKSDIISIKEEVVPTNGKYQATTFGMTCTSMGTCSTIFEFDLPVNVLSAFFVTGEEHEGDIVNVVVAENTTVGVLMQSLATIGNNVFNVSSTVIENAITGNTLRLTDGVNTNDLDIITNINTTTNEVTTLGYTTSTFDAYTTYVQISAIFAKDVEISKPQRYAYAEKKIGGAYIPAHIPITLKYTNTGNENVRLVLTLEYLY